MQSYLSDFTVIRPRYEKTQSSIFDWIGRAHSQSLQNEPEQKAILLEDLKKIQRGTKKIETRGTLLPDLEHEDWESMSIFRLDNHPRGLGLKERTAFFSKEVAELFKRFYAKKEELPHHLIHVTCTGYASPSGAQKIVSLLGSRKTQVTHAYHMGCYGAFPAIQMGTGFLMSSSENLFVDVVHTELCSLHINPSLHSKGQLVIESLFADGFIKYRVQKQHSSSCFRVLSFLEEIVPDSIEDMSWGCTDSCFEMLISKEVPFKIGQELKSFLERLSKKAGLSFEELLKKAVFAIHPGGPKIIEQVSRKLDLQVSQTEHSFEILKFCGNMSSATIPHIWQKILSDPKVPKDTFVVSVAFGPGLTFAGSILQKQG